MATIANFPPHNRKRRLIPPRRWQLPSTERASRTFVPQLARSGPCLIPLGDCHVLWEGRKELRLPEGQGQGQGQAGHHLSAGWVGSGSFWPFLTQACPENQIPLLPACFQPSAVLVTDANLVENAPERNAGSLQGLQQQFHP